MNGKRLVLTIGLLLGILAAPVCEAATIAVDFQGVLNGASVTRTISNSPGGVRTLDAGIYHFKVVPGGTLNPGYTDIYTFCIEPYEYTIYDPLVYNIVELEGAPTNPSAMGETKANLLRELYGVYFPVNTAALTTLQSAALQIATWEIVRELPGNSLNVYSGNVYYNNSIYADKAQEYLNFITANDGAMRNDIKAAARSGNQDFWLPVPEPALAILLGIGLAAVTLVKRRLG